MPDSLHESLIEVDAIQDPILEQIRKFLVDSIPLDPTATAG